MMNPEDYLSQLARVIQEHFTPSDVTGNMAAARVGYLANKLIGVHHRTCGFFRFKEALLELERRGIIDLTKTQKEALAIRLKQDGTAAARQSVPSVGATSKQLLPPEANTAPFQKLRNPIWLAFVSRLPSGRRFMNRRTGEVRTGEVRTGQAFHPQPSSDWVEIEVLSEEDAKADARAFLQSESLGSNSELLAAIDSQAWHRDFPGALKQHDALLASKWNRLRSNRAIAWVQQWCNKNNIGPDLVFEPLQPSATCQRQPCDLRQMLLSAISQMSTDELLSLHVPAKYLVSVLRPDLVSK